MRHVLLSICGLSPQVVTETLYCLTRLKKPPVIPDKIVLITTGGGEKKIKEFLMAKGKGQLFLFFKEYNLNPGRMRIEVQVLKSPNGETLEDIVTDAENDALGDQIVAIVHKLTQENDTTLHASLAGGRKTMSFYLGAAMMLYGRPQDTLSHVLVDPILERCPDFFYPTKEKKILTLEDPQSNKVRADARKAKVTLSDIPFVRLREWIPELLDLGPFGFRQMMKLSQNLVNEYARPVTYDVETRFLLIGDVKIKLTPLHLSLYAHFLKTKAQRCPHKNKAMCGECTDCFETIYDIQKHKDEIHEIYRHTGGKFMAAGPVLDDFNLRSTFSEIKDRIRKAFYGNPVLVQRYSVNPAERIWDKGAMRYGLRLCKTQVRLL